MAFTPSNLALAQLGSLKLTIATCNSGTVSGTDYWTSGIPDIIGVLPVLGAGSAGSITDLATQTSSTYAITWTGSTGTIHLMSHLSNSGSGLTLFVLSGFATDMTW